MLEIKNLHATFEKKEILKGVCLTVPDGEIHALMGPNGSGKSTLTKVIAGHPAYTFSDGEILLNGKNLENMTPEERSRAGLFLVFQHPREIIGVNFQQFLHTIHRQKILNEYGKTLIEARKEKELRKKISPVTFKKILLEKMARVQLEKDFLQRSVNEGFSGGEKKKAEILQMEILRPKFLILDELDSGLDVDALRIVCQRIQALKEETGMGILLITHHSKILEYLPPDVVHRFERGSILESGGAELATRIEQKGYTP